MNPRPSRKPARAGKTKPIALLMWVYPDALTDKTPQVNGLWNYEEPLHVPHLKPVAVIDLSPENIAAAVEILARSISLETTVPGWYNRPSIFRNEAARHLAKLGIPAPVLNGAGKAKGGGGK